MKHCRGTSPGTALVKESHEREISKFEVALGCSSMHGPCLGASGVAEVQTALSEPKNLCSFPSGKNWLNLPHSSFPFWKGKEALNFLSPYSTIDKWQSGSFTHGNQRGDETQVVTSALQ